jgi:histone H2B
MNIISQNFRVLFCNLSFGLSLGFLTLRAHLFLIRNIFFTQKIEPSQKMAERKKKRNASLPKGEVNFQTKIHKVLNIVHPEMRITGAASGQLNTILNKLGVEISKQARILASSASLQTLKAKQMQGAVQVVLPGELAKHAKSEGVKAITKFKTVEEGKPAEKAGLLVRPVDAEKILRKEGLRVGADGAVYLAAILEYLAAEILELAGKVSQDNKRSTIKTQDLSESIEADEELVALMMKLGLLIAGATKTIEVKGKTKTVKGETKEYFPLKGAGAKAMRHAKSLQKENQCVSFAKLPFERLVKELSQDASGSADVRIASDASIALQLYVESHLEDLLKKANQISSHCGREGVKAKDLRLARKLAH